MTNGVILFFSSSSRRIIEYYFSFLGGEDINQFHTKFPDGERQVFKALISWANSGSHSTFDDFSAATALYDPEKFLCVFKKLFFETNHISHYNMMMKIKVED